MNSDFKSSYLLKMNLNYLKPNTRTALFTDYPVVWTVKRKEPENWLCFSVGYYST